MKFRLGKKREPLVLMCKVTQARNGRWQWGAYDDSDKCVTKCMPNGFATREEAEAMVTKFNGAKWVLVTPDREPA